MTNQETIFILNRIDEIKNIHTVRNNSTITTELNILKLEIKGIVNNAKNL